MVPDLAKYGDKTARHLRKVVIRTIMFVDLERYSARMSVDEVGTLDLMSSCFDAIRALARRYNSDLIKTTGDGALLLFIEAAEAVEFALEFHRIVEHLQFGKADPARFRIGIHYGEVSLQDGDAFGHAVNIASRLQVQADPGGCIISRSVRENLADDSKIRFQAVGAPSLKNISERISIYRVSEAYVSAPAADIAPFKLETIGGLRLLHDIVEESFTLGVKQVGVLGYLALCDGHSETFDRLVSLIWRNSNRSSAKQLLKNSLRRIEYSLSPVNVSIVRTGKNSASLDPLKVQTDLDDMEQQILQGIVPDILLSDSEWSSRIMAGCEALSPIYASWLRVSRESWRSRILKQLVDLAENAQPQSKEACDAASAILLHEPGNEIGSAVRIRHLTVTGNRPAALTEYERLRVHLSERFGIGPSERVLEAVRLARMPATISQVVSARPLDRRRLLRIGLAPFCGQPSEDDHRCDAFRGDLLTNLTRIREWSVMDMHNLVGLRGDGKQMPDYWIEGRFLAQAMEDEIAISLRETSNSRVIWRDKVSVSMENWTERQRLVIAKIAATIDSYISADRLSRVIPDLSCEQTSHDDWLRGNQLFMCWTPEAAEEAQRIFELIITVDPGFAPAYSSLAGILMVQHVIWPGRAPKSGSVSQAERLAAKAVELDPMDARNQRAIAWAAAMNGEFDRASLHLDLCMNLNPNSPANLSSCAMAYAWLGDRRKSEALINRLFSITRNLAGWMWCYLASSYFFLGNMEDALNAAKLSRDAIADNQGWMAAILARMNRPLEAKEAFDRLISNIESNWVGEEQLNTESVIKWFHRAYPIRMKEDRDILLESLMTAAQPTIGAEKRQQTNLQ